jgi:basic membrane protein A
MITKLRTRSRLAALAMGAVLIAGACGNDDSSSSPTAAPATTAGGATTVAPATTAGGGETPAGSKGLIGYVVAGDRNDGGFYQGQVDAVTVAAQELGYDLIVVDKVNPGAAREAFENLARQSPVLIIGGGSELTEGFAPVSEAPEFADITFVMVSGGPPRVPTYATVGADENEAHYMGGVAMGLLLQRGGGDTACIVAGPELPFVKNMDASMRAGMASVDPSFKMLVTYTGDFEDAALAQEAVTAQINQGCKVVYPYLGGALVAVLRAGGEAGIGLTATSIDLCDVPSMGMAMSIMYNPALFLGAMIQSFERGEVEEGKQFALYGVGDGLGVGARICDATPAEEAVLEEARAGLASGTISNWLG